MNIMKRGLDMGLFLDTGGNNMAILFSEMTPDKEWEDKFNEWYNKEHIPIRLELNEFITARRYKEVGTDKYLAVYEMDTLDALNTPGYKNIKENPSEITAWMLKSVGDFTRYLCAPLSEQKSADGINFDTPYLYTVMFEVPADREEEFNNWYEQEHVPLLLKNEHWNACRRYKIESGEPDKWTHLALHYLSDLDALNSKERDAARNTEWRNKLSQEEWFSGKYMTFELVKTFNEQAIK